MGPLPRRALVQGNDADASADDAQGGRIVGAAARGGARLPSRSAALPGVARYQERKITLRNPELSGPSQKTYV